MILETVVFGGWDRKNVFTSALSFLLFFLVVPSVLYTPRGFRITVWASIVAILLTAVPTTYYSLTGYVSSAYGSRQSALSMDPNYLAVALVMIFPFCIYQALLTRRKMAKLFAFGTAGVLIAALFATQSRGGMVAMAVTLFTMAVLSNRRSLGITVLIVVLIGGWFATPERVKQRFKETSVEEGARSLTAAQAGVQNRLLVWKACWGIIKDHPVFGAGPGWVYWRVRDYGYPTGSLAHNKYISIAAGGGMVLLFFYMGALVLTVRDLMRIRRYAVQHERRDLLAYSKMFLAAIAGYCAAGMFLHCEREKYYWLIVLVTVSLVRYISELRAAEHTETAEEKTEFQRGSLRWQPETGLTESS